MSRKLNDIVVSLCMVIVFFLSIPSQVFSRDLTSIRDIDMLGVSAYVNNGVLRIGFFYKNRDSDKLVFWREGQLSIECQIFENEGNGRNKEKGSRIGVKNHRVTNFGQDIYWDVPRTHLNKGKRAIIECSTHTGTRRLTATDETRLDD